MSKIYSHEGDSTSLTRSCWLLLALLAIHILAGLAVEQPTVLSDELGYLGHARFLAGASHLPEMEGNQFYHFGYSLFLVPVFWIFADPLSAYQAVIVVNAFLAASLYLPLTALLILLFRLPASTARWIAFACCLYPPVVFHSGIAWSENAYFPLYATAMVLFGRVLGSRRSRDMILFGAVAGFLYTVHPRAVPVLIVVVVYLLTLAILRSISVRLLALGATAIAGVVTMTRVGIDSLKAHAWAGGGETFIAKLAIRVMPDHDLPALLERIAGQALYLMQASYGLALLGLIAAIWLVLERVRATSVSRALAEPLTGVVALTVLSSGAVFIASSVAKLYSIHGPDGVRGGDLIYGRYNEAAAVLLIAFALADWGRRRLGWRQLAPRFLAVIAVLACLTAVVGLEIDDALERHRPGVADEFVEDHIPPAGVRAPSAPGVYPLIVFFGGLKVLPMSLVVVVTFTLLVAAMTLSRRLGFTLLIAFFLVISAANHRIFLQPSRDKTAPRTEFVSHISVLGPVEEISYDAAFRVGSFYSGIQYLMPETRFRRFNSKKGELPTSQAVVSSHDWKHAEKLGARFFVSARPWNNALWLLPGELSERARAHSATGELLTDSAVIGVRAIGLGRRETNAGRKGQWTNGKATVWAVIDPDDPPLTLGIDIGATGRDGATLELRANDVELWNDPIPRQGGAKTFSLDGIDMAKELKIEILSDTVTRDIHRRKGPLSSTRNVFVRNLRLDTRESLAKAVTEGITLGTQQVLGYRESGFYRTEYRDGHPTRWTNGAARLVIPLHPQHLPNRLLLSAAAPGRDGVRLQILANGFELWNDIMPREGWSQSLDLAAVPLGDELILELLSDTFRPAEIRPGSKDPRTLGIAVWGLQLSARP